MPTPVPQISAVPVVGGGCRYAAGVRVLDAIAQQVVDDANELRRLLVHVL
jgi:hypothetical protein